MSRVPGVPVRIAIVSPWPPAHTGIADFVRDLAVGLAAAGHEIVVFTNTADPVGYDGVYLVVVDDEWDGAELAGFEFRLYELGNNMPFHAWMLRALLAYPGVVHLHDMVLHHLFAGLTCALGNWPDYLAAIVDWYGEAAATEAEGWRTGSAKPVWDTPSVVDMPLFEVFVQQAEAVIVHSRYAAVRLANQVPRLPVRQLDQTYRTVPARRRQSLKRIGVFGGVDRHKKVEWIIEAFGYLGSALQGVEVVVVGALNAPSELLLEQARQLGYVSVEFVGRISEEEFIAELDRADLCISLRYPTMGETSAIVMRALQMGLPTIVSDTGWYAELPSEVLKAPHSNTPHFIASTLQGLITQPERFDAWAAACARLPAVLDLSHDHTCADVVDFLQTYRAERFATDLVGQTLIDIGMIGDFSERHVLAAIEPSARWPWRKPRTRTDFSITGRN